MSEPLTGKETNSMAEPEEPTRQQDGGHTGESNKATGGKIARWLVPAAAIVVCAGAGFVIGRVFGTRGTAQAVSAAEQASRGAAPVKGGGSDSAEGWYYDLEPIVANLNEPGVTRYVRVTLTLEVDAAMKQSDGVLLLDQKKPLMKHWLTLYLSNQTMDDIRGEKNLRHVQSQIADTLNQGMFPDARPLIKRVLFKELSIQ